MASVNKQRASRYWCASYRDATGTLHQVSTKIEHTPPGVTDSERKKKAAENKRLALRISIDLEEAERGNATEAHLRKVLAGISARVNRRKMEFAITQTFLGAWLDRVHKMKSIGAWERYKTVVETFTTSLGPKASAAISDITPEDVQNYIASRLESGRGSSTVATDIKILNVPFALAVRQGQILTNPVANVQLPDAESEARSRFTWKQVCDLVGAATGEWKTVIMLGAYTGARLGDCVSMTWGAFDFQNHTLKFRPKKTSRKKKDLVMPIHPDLEEYLLKLPISDKPETPLCPALCKKKAGGEHGLSTGFHAVIAKAGIEQETIGAKSEGGRSFNKFSFHSLRHTYISAMANAGIAPDVRMKLSGHGDEKTHAVYTDHDLSTLRDAINKLPTIKS